MLSLYKAKGLKDSHLKDFINKLYTKEASTSFDGDEVKEEEFANLIGEIIGFCPSPFFWDVPLEEYMKKWEKFLR